MTEWPGGAQTPDPRWRPAAHRVIMLTVLSVESEILEALELGACDHVAKPFSLPVLLQRIRHTLQV